jgi:hypothetical protein
MNRIIVSIMFSFLLSSCAAPHDCKLGYECNNAIEALESAREGGGNSETVMPNSGNYQKLSGNIKSPNKENDEKGRILTMGKTVLRGQPVYIPDSPLRVTIMPIKTTDDVLIGAHEIYFRVPGGYSIGINETGSAGGAAGIFGPLSKKENLGFTPDFDNERATRVVPEL